MTGSGQEIGREDSFAEYENRPSYTGMIFQGHSRSSVKLLGNEAYYDYGDLRQSRAVASEQRSYRRVAFAPKFSFRKYKILEVKILIFLKA